MSRTQTIWFLFLLAAALTIIVVVFGYKTRATKISNLSTFPYQTFHSNMLYFTVIVPKDMAVKSTFTTVDFYSTKGDIEISRIGTNFNNLNDYLSNLAQMNKLTFFNREDMELNGYQTTLVNLRTNNSRDVQKTYFIYTNGWVFNLTTNSPLLYKDLDYIAESFQYTQ